MSDKLERLKNIIIAVIIQQNLVKFGGDEHLNVLDFFDNIKTIEEFKKIDNTIVYKAIDYILKNDKLSNYLLENDISEEIKVIYDKK